MIEEYCKCKYSVLLKALVISHFSFVISHRRYELTKKRFFLMSCQINI